MTGSSFIRMPKPALFQTHDYYYLSLPRLSFAGSMAGRKGARMMQNLFFNQKFWHPDLAPWPWILLRSITFLHGTHLHDTGTFEAVCTHKYASSVYSHMCIFLVPRVQCSHITEHGMLAHVVFFCCKIYDCALKVILKCRCVIMKRREV